MGPLSSLRYGERYGLGNGNDLYLLSELRAVHHPSYHVLLRRYGMAASSPHQPLAHHCRELPVGDLRLWVPDSCRLPALGASGELSLRALLSDGAFIGHWSSLLSAAALGVALGVAF